MKTGISILLILCHGLLAGFSALAQESVTNIYQSYYSSWDSYGIETIIRVAEYRSSTTLVGRGPLEDRYGSHGVLRESVNILGFAIPPLTGAVASAELRLRLGDYVTVHGAENFKVGSVSNLRTRLELHRRMGHYIYDDFSTNKVYGVTSAVFGNDTAIISLGREFIETLYAAQGKMILLQGSITTLSADPFSPEYLYLANNGYDFATLVLAYTNAGAPTIVRGPENRQVSVGSSVDLSVLARGAAPLEYQWQYQGSDLTGATNANLLLSNLTFAQAGKYRVRIRNVMGEAISQEVSVDLVESPPFFVKEPVNLEFDAGSFGNFLHGLAGGFPPPQYQWQVNGTNLAGATNSVLTFQSPIPARSGMYALVASNTFGSVTSAVAVVSIRPFNYYDLSDRVVLMGQPVELYFYCWGAALPNAFQWCFNGVPIPGGIDPGLVFEAAPETAGNYQVIASNEYGAVTSRVARITVERRAPIFGNRLYDQTFVAGSTNVLYVEATAGPPATFYWHFNSQLIPGQHTRHLELRNFTSAQVGQYSVIASNALGMATNGPAMMDVVAGRVSVSGSQYSVGVGNTMYLWASYEGILPATFQWLRDGQPIAGATNASFALYSAEIGDSAHYAIAVTNVYGGIVSSPTAVSVVGSAPSITYQDSQVSRRVGDYVWLAANVYGAPLPVAQWLHDGVPIPGATNYMLALSNLSTQDAGAYTLTVVGTNNQIISNAYPTMLEVTPRTALDEWTWLHPNPQSNPLRGVAQGNGRCVAVGGNGMVLVSTNGQTWVTRHLGRNIEPEAITYGNGLFVMVGKANTGYYEVPAIMTSPDGFTWTACDVSARGGLKAIAYGNGRFVAVGANTSFEWLSLGVVIVSEDGIHWRKQPLPPEMGRYDLTTICYGHGKFVALSSVVATDPTTAQWQQIFVSSDGLNWQAAGLDAPVHLQAITTTVDGFLAAGDVGQMARSQDGLQWTVFKPTWHSDAWQRIASGNGVCVAIANSDQLALISGDTTRWDQFSFPTTHDINAVIFSDGEFVAVTDAGRILVSTNGTAWYDQCVGTDADLYGVVQGPEALVVVGDGPPYYTRDGVRWQHASMNSSTRRLRRVTYGNGLYVAVGRDGDVLTSVDGSEWTLRETSAIEYLESVIWANNRFVAVGEAGLICTSEDGTNWTKLAKMTDGDLESIAYGNGVFVAVGGYFDPWGGAVGTVVTSSDGINWVSQPYAFYFGKRARAVTYGNGQFVLVGNDGLAGVSTDGRLWQRALMDGENLRGITYLSGRYVAVGNEGRVASSMDGLVWAYHTCPAWMNLRDVFATDNGVIAIGSNGAILQSGSLRPTLVAQMSPGGFNLNIMGGFETEYQVQSSTDLKHWTDIQLYTNGTPCQLIDPSANGSPARYYRIVPSNLKR